ncbi:hemicentin-1-like [Ruditapes philippinarum]|uniref:hemicentin-1-like n=1 Tax=Ruditapes philippinarum TaxID=129788 RepID=UPI00295B9F81|nr:hemicentin-1-like [Ruditapes philippinarum]
MKRLNSVYVFYIGFIAYINAGTIERIYIHGNKPALKGSNIQLVCEISQFSSSDILQVYKSSSKLPSSLSDVTSMARCLQSLCLTGGIGRYTFSADNSNVYINISSVNRSEDQKWWTCAIINQRKDMLLNVITVPTSLQYENPPTQDQDLAQNAVQLKCSTGCSYPQATLTWYYSESGKDSHQAWSSSGSASDTTTGCSDSERKYSSTLSLPRYTTFPGNIQKTVKFKCSIQSFTGMSQPLYASYSTDIQFAVKVSSATLKDGSSTVSGQLQVVSGVSKTLTCDTSVSRPAATIVWYIGTESKQTSTSKTLTFNPQNSDHSEQVYCKAFNTQPESHAVASYKASLNVQVQVSSATLKDGPSTVSGQLQVVSGVTKTLTCETSVSRPAATIVWYIGTEKQRSTSNTFTFNPQNSDHTKQVYCKAFNTQPESQAVVSYKSSIYVKVYATTPTLTNKTTGSMILLETDPITMECITSATRPAATVTWWKGSSSLTKIQNTNINQGNLISVKSVVSFTPGKADDRKVISCQSVVSGQDNRPSAQQTITVFWPPATPSIPTSEFPFLENQTGKSIYCSSQDYGNPASTARWNKQYGTPDNSDSRKLHLPTMTSQMDGSSVSCQLDNYFTLVKGSTIKSPPVKLEVEYNPITHTMVDGIITKSVTRNEGQTLSILCNATGNPTPTVKWIRQSASSSSLTFHDIDRNNHGIYTCRAEATSEKYRNHDFVTETIIDVIVNHAPNVSVLISEADPVENKSLQISCHASGRPANYTFTSMVQTWRRIKISNTHLPGNFNGVINIQKLQLQDSGTYICHVNNGITDRNQQLDQFGKTDVSVKVCPKVLLEDGYKFAGASGKPVNLTIPFFSYPGIKEVNFQFQNGTVIRNSNKYTISYTRKYVTTKFYDKTVELEGYVAILRIEKEEQKDFVNYTLVLKNGVGEQTNWNIHHISESMFFIH